MLITLPSGTEVEITREQAETLYANVIALNDQRNEVLEDVKVVLRAIAEMGQKFGSEKELMAFVAKVPVMLLKKQNPFGAMTQPFEAFAAKYGPICFPELYQTTDNQLPEHG